MEQKRQRVAVVTGASGGIGKACAIKLAEMHIRVVVNYNNNEKKAKEIVTTIHEKGGDAVAVKADLSKNNEVKLLIDSTVQRFGQIDILINCAGMVRDSFIMMADESSFDQCVDINIKSCFLCCKYAALKMFRAKKGYIINMSSVSAMKGIPGQSIYSSTKGAMNSFTRVLAAELAPHGISVNAVAPGFIKTKMLDGIPQEKLDQYISMIPVKRLGEPENVADLVAFLCSGKGDYITGQVIVIDGGLGM